MKIKETNKIKKGKVWEINRIVIDVPDNFDNEKKQRALSRANDSRDKKRDKEK